MYPSDELKRLARHKRHLVARSEFLRAECATASATLEKPFVMAKRARAIWERVSFLLTPLSVILAARGSGPRAGLIKIAAKWAPKLFRLARVFSPATLRR